MKFIFATSALMAFFLSDLSAQEFKVITTIESIVPMGAGRSRIIESQDNVNTQDFTTERKLGTDSKQGNVKRKNLKTQNISETKLLNFYSAVGINIQNVASNDVLISSKINELTARGWTLAFVTSGVESDAGKTDSRGIFITRYIFKR